MFLRGYLHRYPGIVAHPHKFNYDVPEEQPGGKYAEYRRRGF